MIKINKGDRMKITKENAVGTKILYSDYPGRIMEIYDWPMVNIRLARGEACVDIAELIPQSC